MHIFGEWRDNLQLDAGQYAFLVLTVNVLVFGAQEDLAQQLEATVLNVAGSLLAIWLSALGIYLSSTVAEESASSRALQAAWLVLIVFVGEWCTLNDASCELTSAVSQRPSLRVASLDWRFLLESPCSWQSSCSRPTLVTGGYAFYAKPSLRMLTRFMSRRSSRQYTIGSGWYSLRRSCLSCRAR
jgi:hypothetical protein